MDMLKYNGSSWFSLVTDPPEFSESSCPDSIVWVEGKERMFGCRSEGNPTPEEKCTLDLANLPLQTTTTFSAERNMSGIYTCQASNFIGTVNKSVEVTVQCMYMLSNNEFKIVFFKLLWSYLKLPYKYNDLMTDFELAVD